MEVLVSNNEHLKNRSPYVHNYGRAAGKGGAASAAVNKAKTHCKNGHEYTPENTKIKINKKNGKTYETRNCLQCRKDYEESKKIGERVPYRTRTHPEGG